MSGNWSFKTLSLYYENDSPLFIHHFSCRYNIYSFLQKERSCEGCKENNKPPTAVAGPDQVITLPADSILLDGSASNDPDGIISEWLWKKISGPASFNMVNAALSKTIVRNLDTGIYRFELKVTDNGNLSATDTVQITINDRGQPNRPPVANAGTDQTITLPTNTINLNGSASTDPDNNIVSYAWKKISGPSTFSIANANSVQTQVTNLVEGVYQFELTVTDAGGLVSKDTLQVAVINQQNCCGERPYKQATLTQIGNLSVPRLPIAASVGNKVFFAGGWSSFNCTATGFFPSSVSSVVDIYNIQGNSWSVAQLSVARAGIRTVSLNNKIFFAGGENGVSTVYDNVDIYDASSNTWTTAHLSTPRAYLSTAAIGTKVFFAGGYYYTGMSPIANPLGISNIVDIYDVATNQWSTATLSGTTTGLYSATSLNGKVYFAGGNNNGIINIYDNNTNSWSTSNFQISWPNTSGSNPLASFAAGDNIYWAGFVNECLDPFGDTVSNGKVEIRNTINNTTTINCFPRVPSQHPVFRNNEVAFFHSHMQANWSGWSVTNHFAIYDIAAGNWSTGHVNNHQSFIASNHDAGIVSANNTIYVGGWSYPGASCVALFDEVFTLSW